MQLFRVGVHSTIHSSVFAVLRSRLSLADLERVWTIGNQAELSFRFARPRAFVLRALVQAFLTPTHRRMDVRIFAERRKVARWTFSLDSQAAGNPQWREASIRPINRDGALNIAFS